MTRQAILFISDVHTHYSVINDQVKHAESTGWSISRVIVLGDFGFFGSHLHEYFRTKANRFTKPVAFIDGNHEDHGALPKLSQQYADVVEYLPRSSIVETGPFKGLCLGGTRYMDAVSTPRGSEISRAEIDKCLTYSKDTVNLILTHDCPTGIGVPGTSGMECYGEPGVPAFAELVEHFHPRFWFFGHHHRWFDGRIQETRFIGLPESWVGYVLLGHNETIEMVKHDISIETRPWWQKFLSNI